MNLKNEELHNSLCNHWGNVADTLNDAYGYVHHAKTQKGVCHQVFSTAAIYLFHKLVILHTKYLHCAIVKAYSMLRL